MLLDSLPVPPSFSCFISVSQFINSAPVPCGPRSPLCPGTTNKSILNFFISISKTPALCDPSTRYKMFFFLHSCPIFSTGIMVPVRFETWVVTTSLVLILMFASISSTSKLPSFAHWIIVFSIPYFSNSLIGRNTELCSIVVVITWSPGFKTPFIAWLSPSVALKVNITFIGSSRLNNCAINSLVSYITLAPSIAIAWLPLPGFAPYSVIARITLW